MSKGCEQEEGGTLRDTLGAPSTNSQLYIPENVIQTMISHNSHTSLSAKQGKSGLASLSNLFKVRHRQDQD